MANKFKLLLAVRYKEGFLSQIQTQPHTATDKKLCPPYAILTAIVGLENKYLINQFITHRANHSSTFIWVGFQLIGKCFICRNKALKGKCLKLSISLFKKEISLM